MQSSRQLVLTLSALSSLVQPGYGWFGRPWGNDYGYSAYYLLGRPDAQHSEQYMSDHAYITQVSTTIQVPDAPVPLGQNGLFGIFPGLQNDWGDLIQSVIAYFPQSNVTDRSPCGGVGGYCAFCNFFSNQSGNPEQWSAKGTSVNTGDTITISYAWDASSETYSQTMQKDGQTISQMNRKPSGPIHQWSPKTECLGKDGALSPPHIYRDTTIKIYEPVADYPSTAYSVNTTASDPTTTDNGQTWSIQAINVAGIDCQPEPDTGTTLEWIVDKSSEGSQGDTKRKLRRRQRPRHVGGLNRDRINYPKYR